MMNIVRQIKSSEFLRNVLTLVSANTLAQAIALLIYPMLTRIYTTEEHGLFALYMSIISITAIVSTGKYEMAVILPKEERKSLGLLKLSISISIVFSVFLLLMVIPFRSTFAHWLGNSEIKNWLIFVPFSTILIAFFQAFTVYLNRKKKYKRLALGNLSQSIANSTVKISSSNYVPSGGGLIIGAVVGQLIGAIYFLFHIKKKEKKIISEIKTEELRHLAREYKLFPKFNLIHYLVNNFSTALPVFFFSSAFSAAQVGLYSLAFMMINRPMNLLTNSFFQVFSQHTIEKHNKQLPIYGNVKKMVSRLFLIAIIPFLIAGIVGPHIFGFVFGESWADAGKYMQYLLPWLFVVFLSSSLSFLSDMLGRQQTAMWIDILKFILRALVLYIGIKMDSIILSIKLFSGISFIMVLVSLFWYLNLARKADQKWII
jgi:O-antigen/teichoic acid export membrane protein